MSKDKCFHTAFDETGARINVESGIYGSKEILLCFECYEKLQWFIRNCLIKR